MLQQIALGGTMIVLPIYLQMVFEYNALEAGLSLAPLSLSMFAVATLAAKRAGKRRSSGIIRIGFLALTAGLLLLLPIVPRAHSGWALVVPLIIAVVLSCIGMVRDVPYTGPRQVDLVGSALSVVGMGGIVLSILVWQEGGEYVGGLLLIGLVAMGALVWWLRRRQRQEQPALLDPELFASKYFRLGVSQQLLQQIALGGTMIVLPIYLQMVLEYNALEAGLSIAPLSLSMFAIALVAGRRAGRRRPSTLVRWGFALLAAGLVALLPLVPRANSGWYLLVPLAVAGCGLGLLVSQLNSYTLSPISDERVSEAAGVNSAAGSFGLSFGLAFAGAIMLAALSTAFTREAESSSVLSATEQQQVAAVLEDDAQLMSNTGLDELLTDQPAATREEIIRINTDTRPLALQIALAIPILAGLLGLANSFRMAALPDPTPSGSAEGLVLG
jgi:Na+/melibiose symporter-like transporter